MATPVPDSNVSSPLPAPEASDSSDVVSCLETAQELWSNGQTREAIRWIQRGAAAAEQAGNDLRALKLARIGAELAAEAEPAPAPAAPSSQRAPNALKTPSVAVAKPDGDVTAEPPTASVAPTPSSTPSTPTSTPSTPSNGAGAPHHTAQAALSAVARETPSPPSVGARGGSERASLKPSLPSARPASSMTPRAPAVGAVPRSSPTATATPVPGSAAPGPASVAPSVASSRSPVSGIPAVASASIYTPEELAARTAQSTALAELVSSGRAQRVTVKRSALDASLLVVRPAAGNGSKVVSGSRTAVLIYLDGEDS